MAKQPRSDVSEEEHSVISAKEAQPRPKSESLTRNFEEEMTKLQQLVYASYE